LDTDMRKPCPNALPSYAVRKAPPSVKIFILVAVSNAMNPRETLPVPSLRRAVVPGPYAKSHSVSLDLQ